MNDDELILAYTVEQRSLHELARKVGTSSTHLRNRLAGLGVEFRDVTFRSAACRERARESGEAQGETFERRDDAFVAAIFRAHPLGYLGPWYDRKAGRA